MQLTKKPILRGQRLAYALAIGFLLVCLAQIASVALLMMTQEKQQETWQRMQMEIYPAMNARESLQNLFIDSRMTWRSYLQSGDPKMRERFEGNWTRLRNQMNALQKPMAELGETPAASLASLQNALDMFHQNVLLVGLAKVAPVSASEFQELFDLSEREADDVKHSFSRLKSDIETVYMQTVSDIDRSTSINSVTIGSLVIVALVITGYIGWLSLRATRFFRQAENERRAAVRQGQFFKAMLDQLPAGVSVRSAPGGDTVIINRVARQIMGQAKIPQSVTQVTPDGVAHSDGRPYQTNELPMMRAMTGETVSDEEMIIERAAGGRSTVLCSSTPIIDETKKPIAAITIFQDISERKKLESNLQQKTRELDRLVAEQRHQIVWLKQLQEISAKVAAQTSVRDICSQVIPAVASMMDVHKCCVKLADAEVRNLHAVNPAHGMTPEHLEAIGSIPIVADGSPLMKLFWDDAFMLLNNTASDPAAEPYRAAFAKMEVRSIVAVRLAARGRPIGVIAAFDKRDGQPFTEQDVQLLRILASPIAIALDNARLYESLRERNEQLATLLQEAHHRIKNNLAMITSLLSLEMSYGLDKSAAQLCSSAIARIESIAQVHGMLTRDSTHGVPIQPLIEQLVHSLMSTCLSPHQHIEIDSHIAPLHLPSREATALALVVSELLSNALRHGFADRSTGRLHIQLSREGSNHAVLVVSNDGIVMVREPQPTRHGLGLRIIETLAKRDLKGSFTVTSANDKTEAVVRFELPDMTVRG